MVKHISMQLLWLHFLCWHLPMTLPKLQHNVDMVSQMKAYITKQHCMAHHTQATTDPHSTSEGSLCSATLTRTHQVQLSSRQGDHLSVCGAGRSRGATCIRALCSGGSCLHSRLDRHQRCTRHWSQLHLNSGRPPGGGQSSGSVPHLCQPCKCVGTSVHLRLAACQHHVQLPGSSNRQVGRPWCSDML